MTYLLLPVVSDAIERVLLRKVLVHLHTTPATLRGYSVIQSGERHSGRSEGFTVDQKVQTSHFESIPLQSIEHILPYSSS